MLTPRSEDRAERQAEPVFMDPPWVESEFFTQLQELRDRIRQWEARNGESETRSRFD